MLLSWHLHTWQVGHVVDFNLAIRPVEFVEAMLKCCNAQSYAEAML